MRIDQQYLNSGESRIGRTQNADAASGPGPARRAGGSGDDERQEIPDIPSATPWTAASDLAGKTYYYKTMRDSAVKQVDLNQIDFDSGSESAYTLDAGSFTFEDVTPKR